MSTEPYDGGSAFPEAYYPTEHSSEPAYRSGMSLRDWFAGQAMAANIASPEGKYAAFTNAADIASRSYSMADAMIAERAKP